MRRTSAFGIVTFSTGLVEPSLQLENVPVWPLMVAVGAAEHEAATCVYHETDSMGGITVSSFRFGAAPASA